MLLQLLLIDVARAERLAGYAWSAAEDCTQTDDQLVLCWSMDEDLEPDLPDGYPASVVQAAWQNWSDAAACSAIGDAFLGVASFGEPSDSHTGTVFYWDDPDDELAPGVIGLTESHWDGSEFEVNDLTFQNLDRATVIFNNDVDWATRAEVEAGTCDSDGVAIEAVATHEVGHVWGLGHTCEREDACEDADLRASTMYWQSARCDLSQTEPTAFDAASMASIYGPTVSIHAMDPARPSTRVGAVPFEVCFDASVNGRGTPNIADAHWTFGDGEVGDGLTPCHTYTLSGEFTVTVTISFDDEACATTTAAGVEPSYIVACAPPAPEPGQDAMFTLQAVDGSTWVPINHTDTSPYGCISGLTWDAYRGSSEADITEANHVDLNGAADGRSLSGWAPPIHVDEVGAYVVVLHAFGVGGETSEIVTVDAKTQPEGCASTSGRPEGSTALWLTALAAIGRRRRQPERGKSGA